VLHSSFIMLFFLANSLILCISNFFQRAKVRTYNHYNVLFI